MLDLVGFDFTAPATTQVLIQLGPLLRALAFAEALAHEDASRVGAVLALTSLLMELAAWQVPGLAPLESITALGWMLARLLWCPARWPSASWPGGIRRQWRPAR